MAGCCAAHQSSLMQKKFEVTIIESSNILGAGVRTNWWGGHPYTYGPRHFLTPHQHVFDYFNKYVPLRLCADHQALTYVERDGNFYNFPIHKDDINLMSDKEIVKLGSILRHSKIVVNMFSTLNIESSIFNVPTINVNFQD